MIKYLYMTSHMIHGPNELYLQLINCNKYFHGFIKSTLYNGHYSCSQNLNSIGKTTKIFFNSLTYFSHKSTTFCVKIIRVFSALVYVLINNSKLLLVTFQTHKSYPQDKSFEYLGHSTPLVFLTQTKKSEADNFFLINMMQNKLESVKNDIY